MSYEAYRAEILRAMQSWRQTKCMPVSAEVVTLILEAKARSNSSQRLDNCYQPFLVQDFFKEQHTFEAKIREHINKKEPFNYNFLCFYRDTLGTFKHYVAVSIESDGNKAELLLIDSITTASKNFNDSFLYRWKDTIGKENCYACYTANLQATSYGCSFFALQNLNALKDMTREEKRNALQRQDDTQSYNPFERLPGKILKNAHTRNAYKQNNDGKPLFINKRLISLDDHFKKNHYPAGDQAAINHSIEKKAVKYLESALVLLNDLYEEGGNTLINNVIDARKSFENKNTPDLQYKVADYKARTTQSLFKPDDNDDLKDLGMKASCIIS